MAHLCMLNNGGQEEYCDLQVWKTFFNMYMDLPAELVNPNWEQWKIQVPLDHACYHLVCQIIFYFISFIEFLSYL